MSDEYVQGRPTPSSPNDRAGTTVAPVELTDDDLAVFLDLSSELFGVFHPERGLLWANAAANATLGYGADELRGRQLEEMVHPDDLTSAEGLGEGGSDRGGGIEMRYRCKDGTWRWLEWSARIAPDTGLAYGAARDVTDRHRTRSALRAGEARLQAIVDHSTSGIFVKDREGRYVLVNDSFLTPMRLARDQVLGRTSAELWPGHPAREHDDLDEWVVRQGEACTSDDLLELPDGPHTVMTVRFPLRDEAGEIIGMAGMATDITERTQIEDALIERERLLDTIVRASPDIVSILDDTGRVREVSQASERILGYTSSSPMRDDLQQLVHPEDRPDVASDFLKLLQGEESRLDMRFRIRHAEGHWVTLDARAKALVNNDGHNVGAVVVSRDITADLEFEEELRHAVKAAENASMAKSDFLSRMSHELRTPLNSVLGFAQLLQMDELDEQQQEAVGHILGAGRHLLDLIDEVLDIARIESGRLDLSVEPVALHSVVRDAVDLARPLAEHRSVRVDVRLDLERDAATVLADRQRLLQVLLNLLSNAIKYNHGGGRVDVVVARGAEGQVRITVSDTGPGIRDEDLSRLFEPFDRLGAERSGIEGTGVGLTLSKHLVDRMGGAISVRSELGEGTAFAVELPSAEPARTSAPKQAPRDESAHPAGTLRVLHVEDNLANLELVEQILRRNRDVQLFAAMYGGLALELAREHLPDVVLLDLHLPDMSGSEVLERLRADPLTARIPVVVVSADATPHQAERLRQAGAVAYLTKPVDVRELLSVVEMASSGNDRRAGFDRRTGFDRRRSGGARRAEDR